MAIERILPARARAAPTLAGNLLATPFQFVLSGAERLRYTSFALHDGTKFEVRGRMLRGDGSIEPFRYNWVHAIGYTGQQQDFPLGEGALLTVSVVTNGGPYTVLNGDAWVQLDVIAGSYLTAIALGTLVQAYISPYSPAAWPGTPLEPPTSGPGRPYIFDFAQPVAGAPSEILSKSNLRIKIHNVAVTFTTAAGGTARRLYLQQQHNGAAYPTFYAPVTQPGGTAWGYTFAAGHPGMDASAHQTVIIPLPTDLWLSQQETYGLGASFLAGGDQFTAGSVYGHRWFDV